MHHPGGETFSKSRNRSSRVTLAAGPRKPGSPVRKWHLPQCGTTHLLPWQKLAQTDSLPQKMGQRAAVRGALVSRAPLPATLTSPCWARHGQQLPFVHGGMKPSSPSPLAAQRGVCAPSAPRLPSSAAGSGRAAVAAPPATIRRGVKRGRLPGAETPWGHHAEAAEL